MFLPCFYNMDPNNFGFGWAQNGTIYLAYICQNPGCIAGHRHPLIALRNIEELNDFMEALNDQWPLVKERFKDGMPKEDRKEEPKEEPEQPMDGWANNVEGLEEL